MCEVLVKILLIFSFSTLVSPSTLTSNPARPSMMFSCVRYYGALATVVTIPPSRKERPIIRWRDEWAEEYGISIQERCQNVSKGFQDYYNKGMFRYVIGGRDKTGQGVICVARHKEGPCTGRLWTLRRNDNPDEIVRQLFGILTRYVDPINQSSAVYVDIKELSTSQ